MGLVKKITGRSKKPKLRETKLGIIAFILALISLAHFNFLLMTHFSPPIGTLLFYPILPMVSVLCALLSFTRVEYKKTYTWLALAIYVFIVICMGVIFFFAFTIYPKP